MSRQEAKRLPSEGDRLWIAYDERAEYQDTDKCAVLDIAESEGEARGLPGVVFVYDQIPYSDGVPSLENEQRWTP